jgi:hypothetical protein
VQIEQAWTATSGETESFIVKKKVSVLFFPAKNGRVAAAIISAEMK